MEINGCSIITRRRWRIRGGEWYAFTWFFRHTILHGLLFLDLFGKDRKRTKDGIPLFLSRIQFWTHQIHKTITEIRNIKNSN